MCNGDVGIMRNDCTKVHGRGVLRWMCYVQVLLGYCDKCNCTKLSDRIKVCGRCVLRVKGLSVLFRAQVMMLLRSEVGQQGVPKGIWAVFISNCAIRSFLCTEVSGKGY